MAVGNVMFAFLTALVAVSFILAEENSLESGDNAYDEAESPNAENENEEKHERTFFALFNSYARCNASMGSSYCLSCTQAMRCYSNGIGMYRNCRGFQRYCNAGRCSFYPGSGC